MSSTSLQTPSAAASVQQLAHECGFELAGVASATPVEADSAEYRRWVEAGNAGRMTYLTDHRADLRYDPRSLLPSAQSVICVGKLYNRPGAPSGISMYAAGTDYHDLMRDSLQQLVRRLQQEFGDFDHRVCVDTAPLLERTYARQAGLGWIGKNTCLINQHQGSWFFLGEILTSLALIPAAPPPDRCGTCTRCIDACPTGAIQPGGLRTQLDATRCISYLTIELKGAMPEDLRSGLGTHVFGCDICQEVCPWNRRAPITGDPDWTSLSVGGDLDAWAAMTPDDFRTAFRHTPIWRSKYSGFLRNVAVAMGNSGRQEYVPALQQLASSDDNIVAEHARWALDQLIAKPSACEPSSDA